MPTPEAAVEKMAPYFVLGAHLWRKATVPFFTPRLPMYLSPGCASSVRHSEGAVIRRLPA